MHHNVYLHWMIEWMLFPFNIRHFDCVMHQTTSTTINRSKTVVNEGRTANARHAYNNNYGTQWKDVGSHSCNRQMLFYILPFALFCHRRSRWCKTFLYFVRLVSFFDDVQPAGSLTVGCRYLIVRRTRRDGVLIHGRFLRMWNQYIVWAIGRVRYIVILRN